MSLVVRRSASQAVKSGRSRRGTKPKRLALPPFIPPQLSQPVEKALSGPQWLDEIKPDGFRMAVRIDHGSAQLLIGEGSTGPTNILCGLQARRSGPAAS
jgi:bifunctional non-homologous end joining protein LigD